MKFKVEHLGKWVARKGDKVVAADPALAKLRMDLREKRKDADELIYTFVPKGYIAG